MLNAVHCVSTHCQNTLSPGQVETERWALCIHTLSNTHSPAGWILNTGHCLNTFYTRTGGESQCRTLFKYSPYPHKIFSTPNTGISSWDLNPGLQIPGQDLNPGLQIPGQDLNQGLHIPGRDLNLGLQIHGWDLNQASRFRLGLGPGPPDCRLGLEPGHYVSTICQYTLTWPGE